MDVKRWLVIILLAALAASSDGQGFHTLKPQPNLPIDCSNYSQPCTGTTCVSQQTTVYCAETQTETTCENDTQNYTGGLTICCTGKNSCVDCPYNGRVIHYYQYNGVTSSYPSCVFNP